MADLAATDITVTLLVQKRGENSRVRNVVKLEFGDAALTYPAGGVPITKGKLGCPTTIESLVVFDAGTSGYKWSYDAANEKLVAVQSGAVSAHTHTVAHAHDLLVKGGQASSTTNDIAHYATDILGKEAATDATILGSASATKGGVLTVTPTTSSSGSVAAVALAQPSTVAIAAQVLRCEVVGW